MTLGVAPIVFAVFLGVSGIVALVAGVIAIAITGPMRAGAVTLPSDAAFATLVVPQFVLGADMSIGLLLPPIALGVAVIVARLQRGTLAGPDARRASMLIDAGIALAAMLAGASIGLVLGTMVQNLILVPILGVIGLIGGLLMRSRQAHRDDAAP